MKLPKSKPISLGQGQKQPTKYNTTILYIQEMNKVRAFLRK